MIDIEPYKRAIKAFAKEEMPKEACGFIVGDEVVKVFNAAAKPEEHFRIQPQDWLPDADAIWHSHPNGRAVPSQPDIQSCNATQKLQVIYAYPADEWHIQEPSDAILPLEGREFCHGVLDCYTLVRDYYKTKLDISLPNYFRPDDWWKTAGVNLYMKNLKTNGFQDLGQTAEPQEHDLMLFAINAKDATEPNHAAIYVGGGLMLHHFAGQLSQKTLFSQSYQNRLVTIARHESVTNYEKI